MLQTTRNLSGNLEQESYMQKKTSFKMQRQENLIRQHQ